MATFLLYTCEGGSVSIFDVPGAHLNADMPDEKYVRIKLEGELLDIMYVVNPYHITNISYETGKKVLYLIILNAPYR